MKFAYFHITDPVTISNSSVNTIVIENPSFYRSLLCDLYSAVDGNSTSAVLSIKDKPIEFSKNCEIINDFINFNINQKALLTKICTALESKALSPEEYFETQELLTMLENKISDWSFDLSCNISATKLTVSGILKASGVEICNDYEGEKGDAERIIDYMELVREFDRDKLFITVNMRSFFSDEVTEQFMKTVLSHEFKVLMLESSAKQLLKHEKRLTIDEDLCEF